MASTLSSFDAFLKQYYNPQKVENLTMAGKPFFAKIKKNEAIGGASAGWIVPILYVNPQGVSNNLANAQTAAAGTGGNVQGVKWAISMGDYSGSVSIGDKVLMASRNNIAAFLEDRTTEIDGLYEQFSNSLSQYLWRNGGGATGQRASASTNVITLVNPQDVFNFEVGEYVIAASDDGSAAADNRRAGNTYVTAVDRINGTITLNSAAAITGFADNDYLFRLGDYAGSVVTTFMKGVDAFVTSSTTPGTLWGVTRTTDIQRLSGCKIATADTSGKGIEERIQLLGAYMAGRFRAMTASGTYECYMHPEDWQNLAISMQARGTRSLTDSTTSFNFEYIELLAGGKRIKTYADPYIVKGTAYILRMENWVLGSMGELIRTLNGDGLTMLRAVSSNDYEYRLQSYPAVSCNAPGFQGRVGLP